MVLRLIQTLGGAMTGVGFLMMVYALWIAREPTGAFPVGGTLMFFGLIIWYGGRLIEWIRRG